MGWLDQPTWPPHPHLSQPSTNHPTLQLILELQAWLLESANVGHYYCAHVGLGLVQGGELQPGVHTGASFLLPKGARR